MFLKNVLVGRERGLGNKLESLIYEGLVVSCLLKLSNTGLRCNGTITNKNAVWYSANHSKKEVTKKPNGELEVR